MVFDTILGCVGLLHRTAMTATARGEIDRHLAALGRRIDRGTAHQASGDQRFGDLAADDVNMAALLVRVSRLYQVVRWVSLPRMEAAMLFAVAQTMFVPRSPVGGS